MTVPLLFLVLGLCVSLVQNDENPDLNLLETVAILSQKVLKLEALLADQDECKCNLTEIEEHIRQNGINVAKNRHDILVIKDGLEASIQEVSDIVYVGFSLDDYLHFFFKICLIGFE